MFHFIVTRRDGTLFYGSYYWACSFSLFFVLIFAKFFSLFSLHKTKIRVISIVCFIFFASANLRHFNKANIGHAQALANSHIAQSIETDSNFSQISYKQIQKIWRNRNDMEKVKQLMKTYPKNAYWLYYEAYLQNQKGNLQHKKWGLKPSPVK